MRQFIIILLLNLIYSLQALTGLENLHAPARQPRASQSSQPAAASSGSSSDAPPHYPPPPPPTFVGAQEGENIELVIFLLLLFCFFFICLVFLDINYPSKNIANKQT